MDKQTTYCTEWKIKAMRRLKPYSFLKADPFSADKLETTIYRPPGLTSSSTSASLWIMNLTQVQDKVHSGLLTTGLLFLHSPDSQRCQLSTTPLLHKVVIRAPVPPVVVTSRNYSQTTQNKFLRLATY